VKSWGFSSEYLSGADSVAVVFSDSFRIIHYGGHPPVVFPDEYLSKRASEKYPER